MRLLTKNFWRMTMGFLLTVVISLGFLYLANIFSPGGEDDLPTNYLAGQEAGQ